MFKGLVLSSLLFAGTVNANVVPFDSYDGPQGTTLICMVGDKQPRTCFTSDKSHMFMCIHADEKRLAVSCRYMGPVSTVNES